jgi:hypothetical protein
MVNETNGVTPQLELLARFWRWLRIVDELVRTLNWRAVIDDAACCKRQPNSLTRALLGVQSDELGVLTRLSDVIRPLHVLTTGHLGVMGMFGQLL